MTIVFGIFLASLTFLTLIYGGSLTLNGFCLEYLKNSLKFVILLENYWIYNSFLEIDVPKSEFSIKINELLFFGIELGLIGSFVNVKYYNPPTLGSATFGCVYDYDYDTLDVDEGLFEGCKQNRDNTEDYLNNKYNVISLYDSNCTDDNILNSLENDNPEVFIFCGHGNSDGLLTNSYTRNNPDTLTPDEIKSVSPISDAKLAFILACDSMDDNELTDAFHSINYGVVIGFYSSVLIAMGYYFMTQFFYYAIDEGDSVETAFNNAEKDGRNSTPYVDVGLVIGLIILIVGLSGFIAALIANKSPWALLFLIVFGIGVVISLAGYEAGQKFQPRLREADGVDANKIYL